MRDDTSANFYDNGLLALCPTQRQNKTHNLHNEILDSADVPAPAQSLKRRSKQLANSFLDAVTFQKTSAIITTDTAKRHTRESYEYTPPTDIVYVRHKKRQSITY